MKSFLCALVLLVAVAPPSPAAIADSDSGTFHVSRQGTTIGFETFKFIPDGHGIVLTAHVFQVYPRRGGGTDTLTKDASQTVSAADWDLQHYESHQSYGGHMLHRGLELQDTVMTSFFQIDERGEGTALVRPPGKMFLLDSQVFVLYDAICRNLHHQTFETRPLKLFSLGLPDTLLEATARDLGAHTVKWGERPVKTRKIAISSPGLEFFMWISPQGKMLRLEQPEHGLIVERKAPAVKPASRRPKGG